MSMTNVTKNPLVILVKPTDKELNLIKEYIGNFKLINEVMLLKNFDMPESHWFAIGLKFEKCSTEDMIGRIVELKADEYLGAKDGFGIFRFS